MIETTAFLTTARIVFSNIESSLREEVCDLEESDAPSDMFEGLKSIESLYMIFSAEVLLSLLGVSDKMNLPELTRVEMTDPFFSSSKFVEEIRASLNFEEREVRINDRSRDGESRSLAS